METLFVIGNGSNIIVEKHWRSVIPRTICDYYLEQQGKMTTEDLPPLIVTPLGNLICVQHNTLAFLSVVTEEVCPLTIVELVYRIIDIITDYFGGCTETILKEHIVTVFEILDEVLDNGYPLATESSILKELIKPPNLIRYVVNSVIGQTNVSDQLPEGQLSAIPWRRTGIKYSNNEAYFDLIEEVDITIDGNGRIVTSQIHGYIDCCVKLSGMPELAVTFINPRLIDDVSFHPCVRFKRWEADRILSFVPPDGNFRLISYHISSQNTINLPIVVRHLIKYGEGSTGKFEMSLSTGNTFGKTVNDVVVSVTMAKQTSNMTLTASQGKHSFNVMTNKFLWTVGKIESQKPNPFIRGNIAIQAGATVPQQNPIVTLQFSIPQLTVSGVRIARVDIFTEKYKPFKGVKYLTRAGRYEIRT
ncbi:hypothetical protein SNEBB_005057 [Seison nebaliae]|nr:hypothetical protein SNEBB_005057 [Seison nebaliae]